MQKNCENCPNKPWLKLHEFGSVLSYGQNIKRLALGVRGRKGRTVSRNEP